ncbi:MAG: acetoacetate decarboxylase family protein [Actinobacteria bacterium]|nr:acetoacetate decarboxylase family protein [Actinomycetota bacterium]
MTVGTYTVQGREIVLPVQVRRARSWAAVFSVDARAAQRLVDRTGLRVARASPRRALVTLVFVRYDDGDLDAYHEVGVSFLVHPHENPSVTDLIRKRACVYIHHLPVDQSFTLEAGREIWGYPKFMAGIGLATLDGRTTCALAQDGVSILTLTVRDGGVRMPGQSPPTYTYLDGVLRRTEWESFGTPRGRFGGASLHLGDHPISDELRSLGLSKRALFTSTNTDFGATFGGAEIVQTGA